MIIIGILMGILGLVTIVAFTGLFCDDDDCTIHSKRRLRKAISPNTLGSDGKYVLQGLYSDFITNQRKDIENDISAYSGRTDMNGKDVIACAQLLNYHSNLTKESNNLRNYGADELVNKLGNLRQSVGLTLDTKTKLIPAYTDSNQVLLLANMKDKDK